VEGDAWLTIVVGASGIIAIVLIGLVVRVIRPARSTVSLTRTSRRAGRDPDRSAESGASPWSRATPSRAWSFRSFGPWHRHRSVEGNLQRAFARIDAVDPYELPRRIGSALTEAGLLSEAPEEPPAPRPRNPWPFGQERDRQHGKDDE
jgi:hypothetical protein